MPNIKSAIKRVRVAEKKTMNNSIIKTKYKTAIKKYETANAEESKDASELLSLAKKAIDHASSKGVISKNAASRKKSRLEKKLAVKPEAKKKVATKKAEKKEEPKAEEKKTTKTTAKKTAAKTTTKKATKKED
ncbi:MAG: 30S ribosomal protein S20 [Clostridia bacterium]|nr:30S ribosomal protein S20 [Clostridia bacterium]